MVCDALMPCRRRAATKVIVFQCPCGTWPTSRAPRAHRPYSRTILVLADVSSMNTSRAGSNMPCSRIQRRRARATSARSCSAARRAFFKRDLVPLKKPPYRRPTAGNLALAHRTDHLVQCQVRMLIDQRQQKFGVLLQRRDTPAPPLGGATASLAKALHPNHRRAGADIVIVRCLTARCSALHPPNHSRPHVRRIGLRHRSPPKNESTPLDSFIDQSKGIPPIQSGRNML